MNNTVGNILRKIGIFNIIAGVFCGFFLGNTHSLFDSGANWTVVLLWSLVGFVSGMTFIGFSEIIYLLQGIYIKINRNENISENEVKVKGKADIYNSILNNDTNV
ncbi:hypothetical protein COJ85_28625 [Bacillus sp. AFS076308]|uniref:hypothetical protein n=1 Tax=unclassified Bacillus (in: firmicutes) TaxID=185979 RepID=UPI000BF3B8B3|nr:MULTISPECIES: hypothetical protein [unclassified Bacillus (in: firmicutes)]PFN81998.1 hypothetical protein COJ85_28625 [Bacillus sp. AFS076308]PGV43906.1 hypothetical protein COD92_31435 [Bacillus sp. AFS037270]